MAAYKAGFSNGGGVSDAVHVAGQATKAFAILPLLLSSSGFFSDAYDLNIINLAKNVLADLYPQSCGDQSGLSTAAIVGAVLGQLVFGMLADKLGRRFIFVATISLVIIGALGSATAVDSTPGGIYTSLCIWRGILGFGIGGEYPLAATITSEGSSTARRGAAVSFVFSMQGLGNLAASLIFYVLLKVGVPLETTWRIALACGALPGILTVYWRYRMEESHHFSKLAEGDGEAADAESSLNAAPLLKRSTSFRAGKTPAQAAYITLVYVYLNLWTLAGTAGSWFIFDVVFYANGLFNGSVLTAIGYSAGSTGSQTEDQLATTALGSVIIACIALPGYYLAMALIDVMGRKNMQLMGFTVTGAIFIALAAAIAPLQSSYTVLFVFLYGLTFFFSNFGANTSTFVIPAEAFPTAAKATCHGISAASGKIGAALGAAAMAPLLQTCGVSLTPAEKQHGLALILYICAALSFFGTVWTLIFTSETGKLHIEDLDADFKAKVARILDVDQPEHE